MADFQAVRMQAKAVLNTLGALDWADRDQVRSEIAPNVQRVLSSIGEWESASSQSPHAESGQIRDRIADSRKALHDCLPKLEWVRAEWANRYRRSIGDRKDEYEKLSEQLQQQQSAEAYRWKRNFAQVTSAMEQINRLNGLLLDAGRRIERAYQEAHPPADPGTVERTDRDPATSSNLS